MKWKKIIHSHLSCVWIEKHLRFRYSNGIFRQKRIMNILNTVKYSKWARRYKAFYLYKRTTARCVRVSVYTLYCIVYHAYILTHWPFNLQQNTDCTLYRQPKPNSMNSAVHSLRTSLRTWIKINNLSIKHIFNSIFASCSHDFSYIYLLLTLPAVRYLKFWCDVRNNVITDWNSKQSTNTMKSPNKILPMLYFMDWSVSSIRSIRPVSVGWVRVCIILVGNFWTKNLNIHNSKFF